MEDKLNFMLLGKTGEGKSATGNSLIDRKYFKSSNSASTETKDLSYAFTLFGLYTLLVVDGPDLISGTSQGKEKIEEAKNTVSRALEMCYGGIDAFLLVIKFCCKFTAEDKLSLDALKQILGDRYLDHVIVVMTYGDMFPNQLEDEESDLSFNDWCMKQTGELSRLLEGCKGRVVLFNNKEKDKEKKRALVEEIVQLALVVRKDCGRYTSKHSKYTERETEKLMTEPAEPQVAKVTPQQTTPQIPAVTPQQTAPQIPAVTPIQTTLQVVAKKQLKNEVKLNFLLMGKTGSGKSATGNSILGRRVFKASASATSVTKKVHFSFASFEHYILLVVDGPGLADTDTHASQNSGESLSDADREMNIAKELVHAAKKMDKALTMCYGGVDAFLFVIKFGNRFTAEEEYALNVLKKIFGNNYMDHVIVVVTGGDLFHKAMQAEDQDISFDEWCRKQEGPFRQLYKDCSERVVLFDNSQTDGEKNMAQIQELIRLASDLRNQHGRYTSDCFLEAERAREKLVIELKAPLLTREIQEKICLLTADIEKLSKQPSDTEKENIRTLIQDLKLEIEVQDKGYGALVHLQKKVADLERNLDDVGKLQCVANEMEKIRKDKTIWSKVEEIGLIVGKTIYMIGTLPLAVVSGGIGGILGGMFKHVIDHVRKMRNDLQNTKSQ